MPPDAVELVGVEAGGRSPQPGEHASTLSHGQPGVLHGSYSYVLQDPDGQTAAVLAVEAPRFGGLGRAFPSEALAKLADLVRPVPE